MGLSHYFLKDYERARECLQAAVELLPDQVDVLANYAETLRQCGDTNGALSSCERVLARDPLNGLALTLKVQILADARPDLAWTTAEDLLQLESLPLSAWETLERLCSLRGDTKGARHALQQFLTRANPDNFWESDLEGRLQSARERLAQMEQHLE